MLVLCAALSLWVAPRAGFPEEAVYVGSQKCRGCHIDAFREWEKDGHARAADRLGKRDRTSGRCLQCHATGFAEPASLGQIFEGVQCEACHGPGSLYKGPKIMSKGKFRDDPEAQRRLALEAGMTVVEERVCLRCHGKERPEGHAPPRPFRFPEAEGKVRHGRR
jgi:hypothetical protein